MQAVMDFFNDDARGINYNTDQSKYTGGTVALPKHGWKVFGSWEGLSSSRIIELNHMFLRLCGPPSIPLSFTVAGVLPRWNT